MSNNPPPYSQPGYTPASTYQPAATQQSTVIIQTTSSNPPVGTTPTRVRCPSCHADILTTVKHQATGRTHMWALILCLFLCWPCVCVPYCMDSCQNANHYCPNCNAFIGTYQN